MWLVCEDGSIEQAQAEYGNMMTRHITLFMIIFQLLQHLILQKEWKRHYKRAELE